MSGRITVYREHVRRIRKTSYGPRTFVVFDHCGDTVQLDTEALFELLATLTVDGAVLDTENPAVERALTGHA